MILCWQEQTEAPEIEASASAALQNPVPGLGSQPFLRPTADAGLVDSTNRKQEYDNPYFEPQYGFPTEEDTEEEQVESYTPRFNQNLNGNKYVNDSIIKCSLLHIIQVLAALILSTIYSLNYHVCVWLICNVTFLSVQGSAAFTSQQPEAPRRVWWRGRLAQ